MGSAAERSAVSKNPGQPGAEDDPLTRSSSRWRWAARFRSEKTARDRSL